MRALVQTLLTVAVCVAAAAADKYTGPRPPKPDVPYLMHADNLVEPENADAKEEKRGDETTYVVAGASSPARTPLAEPIFLLETQKIAPESLELYRLEVKNGRRQIMFHAKKKKDNPRPVRLIVSRLEANLYRIEVSENLGLENGEYSLTPAGSNQVFCFQVY